MLEDREHLRKIKDIIECFKSGIPDTSLAAPNGLLCRGGTLNNPNLLAAYGKGLFPRALPGQPLQWWTPSPRCVLMLEKTPEKPGKELSAEPFRITMDQAFPDVLDAAASHPENGISPALQEACYLLCLTGFAHSVEAWLDNKLAGGIYGVSIGRAFFCEAMFQTVSGASSVCLKALLELLKLRGIRFAACRAETELVMLQGGMMLPREDFEGILHEALRLDARSSDTLTTEYLHTTEHREILWPYLPWNHRYQYTEKGWSPLPPGVWPAAAAGSSAPGQTIQAKDTPAACLEEKLARLLSEARPNAAIQIQILRHGRRKRQEVRVLSSTQIEVRIPSSSTDDAVCSFVRQNIKRIAHVIEVCKRREWQREQEESPSDPRLEELLSQILAEHLPDAEKKTVRVAYSSKRKKIELRIITSSHIEVHAPEHTAEDLLCRLFIDNIPWIAENMELLKHQQP